MRRAISCIKKRTGRHENSIREYRIGEGGITVDAPLQGVQGVLQGVPNLVARGNGSGAGRPP